MSFRGHRLKLIQYLSPEGKKNFEANPYDVGYSHVAIRVDNVQEAYDELRAKGARFISRPVHLIEEGSEVTMVYMLDPDSYVVELRCGGSFR